MASPLKQTHKAPFVSYIFLGLAGALSTLAFSPFDIKLIIPFTLVILIYFTVNSRNFIDSCKYVFSTSLHGVIVAHSLNIPALWIKYSDQLAGDNIKFYDYFESVEIAYPIPELNSESYDLNSLIAFKKNNKNIELPKLEKLKEVQKNLIKSCPFVSCKRKRELLLLV